VRRFRGGVSSPRESGAIEFGEFVCWMILRSVKRHVFISLGRRTLEVWLSGTMLAMRDAAWWGHAENSLALRSSSEGKNRRD
jgi:hypothetical protein